MGRKARVTAPCSSRRCWARPLGSREHPISPGPGASSADSVRRGSRRCRPPGAGLCNLPGPAPGRRPRPSLSVPPTGLRPRPGPRPHGHTLSSATVRLRLYRFSERKLLRELLMNTVTVGAEIPATSISPRPAVARGPVQPSRSGSAVAAAPSGIPVPPPALKLANASATPDTPGQSPPGFLRGPLVPPIAAREAGEAGGGGRCRGEGWSEPVPPHVGSAHVHWPGAGTSSGFLP